MIPDNLSKSQLELLIDEWIIGKNAERDRLIIRRRLLDGITFESLADEFDLSVSQTKNIVYKYERKSFPILNKTIRKMYKSCPLDIFSKGLFYVVILSGGNGNNVDTV